jgi:hypothetical protein
VHLLYARGLKPANLLLCDLHCRSPESYEAQLDAKGTHNRTFYLGLYHFDPNNEDDKARALDAATRAVDRAKVKLFGGRKSEEELRNELHVRLPTRRASVPSELIFAVSYLRRADVFSS